MKYHAIAEIPSAKTYQAETKEKVQVDVDMTRSPGDWIVREPADASEKSNSGSGSLIQDLKKLHIPFMNPRMNRLM